MKSSRLNLLLYLALVALSAEIFFLILQNRRLRAEVQSVSKQARLQEETLEEGEKVNQVELKNLGGSSEKLSFGVAVSKRLLFIFNTRCPTCQLLLPTWKELADELKEHVEILGITYDSLAVTIPYANTNAIAYPIFVAADTSFRRMYKIHFVPQTILLDGEGTVLGHWPGTLSDNNLSMIRRIASNNSPTGPLGDNTPKHERR